MEFRITKQWDGQPTGHGDIIVTLTPNRGGLDLSITAPFFDDPDDPGGEKGQPFHGLWDYEGIIILSSKISYYWLYKH